MAHLTAAALDGAALLAEVGASGHGALVLFAGTVRDRHAGRTVRGITYSGYAAMAETVLQRIEAELGDKHGARVRVVHRLGALAVGEVSILIAVGAPRRDAAYAASREALERVKAEAPIWKREHYEDGDSAWREEEALRR